MKLHEDSLEINREKSELDREVLDFVSVLEEEGIDYVIVSGYVAILTGRSRGTEDVDVLIEEGKAAELAERLEENSYWCINEEIDRIPDMLEEGIAPRIAREGKVIPNFELFYPEDRFDSEALENSIDAEINSSKIMISPIELQIAYKLFLGSEKDLEDAQHLYRIFNEDLEMERLERFAEKMNVGDKLDELR
ncbi:MAG: hypothetical protein ABEK16_00100 [Candidatus Nanohalobium sp.]